MAKVYGIICYKGKKERIQLYDLVVYNKKSDANKFLKELLKDIKKNKEGTYRKDGEMYVLIDKKTEEEFFLYVQELVLR